eukprot:SAG31_NODE_44236_length_263_cov_1.262195_1_plen_74_part_01
MHIFSTLNAALFEMLLNAALSLLLLQRADLLEGLCLMLKLLHNNLRDRYADDGSEHSRYRQTKAVRLLPIVRQI